MMIVVYLIACINAQLSEPLQMKHSMEATEDEISYMTSAMKTYAESLKTSMSTLMTRPLRAKPANFLYTRITPPPLINLDFHKSRFDNPFVAPIEALLNEAKIYPNETFPYFSQKFFAQPIRHNYTWVNVAPLGMSLLQADPIFLRNGEYLTRDLRTPSQAFVNAAVRENVPSIVGKKMIIAEMSESKRLRDSADRTIGRMLANAER